MCHKRSDTSRKIFFEKFLKRVQVVSVIGRVDKRLGVVEECSRIGDLEMDTVIGKSGGPVLVAMVERVSSYTLIGLVANKEALEFASKIIPVIGALKDKVLTMTYDDGKEFTHHELLANLLDTSANFAHPYRSWERGLNENTNDLIRQYPPKGTDFSLTE